MVLHTAVMRAHTHTHTHARDRSALCRAHVSYKKGRVPHMLMRVNLMRKCFSCVVSVFMIHVIKTAATATQKKQRGTCGKTILC